MAYIPCPKCDLAPRERDFDAHMAEHRQADGVERSGDVDPSEPPANHDPSSAASPAPQEPREVVAIPGEPKERPVLTGGYWLMHRWCDDDNCAACEILRLRESREAAFRAGFRACCHFESADDKALGEDRAWAAHNTEVAHLPASPAPQEPRDNAKGYAIRLRTLARALDEKGCNVWCAPASAQMVREAADLLAQLTAAPSVLPPVPRCDCEDVPCEHEKARVAKRGLPPEPKPPYGGSNSLNLAWLEGWRAASSLLIVREKQEQSHVSDPLAITRVEVVTSDVKMEFLAESVTIAYRNQGRTLILTIHDV
jgi:hypothetical protein